MVPNPLAPSTRGYRVFKYREFESRIKCFICNTREKAGKTVAIRNESTLEEFDAGLTCLYNHFKITKEQLKDQVAYLRILIKYWLKFVSREVSQPINYKTSNAALASMADFVGDAASFKCVALDNAKVLLKQLQRDVELINEGYGKEEVYSLQTLIALQYEHRYAPDTFSAREKMMLSHPKIQPDEGSFLKSFYGNLSDMTLSD